MASDAGSDPTNVVSIYCFSGRKRAYTHELQSGFLRNGIENFLSILLGQIQILLCYRAELHHQFVRFWVKSPTNLS